MIGRRAALLLIGGSIAGACSPAPAALSTPPVTPAPNFAATAAPFEPNTTASVTPTPNMATGPTPAPNTTAATPTPNTAAAVPTPNPAAASTPTLYPVQQPIWLGVDVLLRDQRDLLRGRKIGLVTNTTGRNRDGASTIDVLNAAHDWKLVALFSPEHGIRGEAAAGETVDSSTDSATGLPIYSLFGQTTRPTPAMLSGLEALVYDIQDVGARVYTYPSTLLEVMRACAEQRLRIVVLDRPNPIGGEQVEGNVLDPKFTSFVGAGPIAMRYGLTIGELARWFNAEMGIGADLHVVAMAGWRRSMWLDETGVEWVNPSPNLRSLAAATVYCGTVLFEGTTLTEGRGTDRPFEWVGAPWIDAERWAARLDGFPGVRFTAVSKTPAPGSAKFPGQLCQGLGLEVEDRHAVQPMALGVAMLQAARAVAPEKAQITPSNFDLLAGTDQLRKAIEANTPAADIARSWQPARDAFAANRQRYFLY